MKLKVHSWMAVLGVALLAGCGDKPAPAPVAKEIKGTPINEPVVAKAPAGAETSTTAAVAPAEEPAPAQPPPAPVGEPQKIGDYLDIGFDRLAAFNYEMPDESSVSTNKTDAPVLNKDQIPANVRAFDKKPIALKGFMLPLKVEGGLITELLIMRDQSMCCYGSVPKINEWVSVKMTGKGLKPIMDQAVTLYGTLHVGEIRENGYLVGIYCMDGEKMAGPLDL
jgi:hypothetical protein